MFEIKNETAECVLTTADPAEASNYLTFADSGFDPHTHRWKKNDGEGLVVSYLNELAAPLLGVTAVREAHGNLAAAELASAVCAEQEAATASGQQAGQKQEPAAINDLLAAGNVKQESKSVQASTKTGPNSTRSRGEATLRTFGHVRSVGDRQSTNRSPLGLGLVQAHARKISSDNRRLR